MSTSMPCVNMFSACLICSFGPLFFLAPPLFVFVPDTQEPATRVKRNKRTIEVERRIEYFSPLQDWLEQIKLTLLSRRCTSRAIACEHFGNQTRPFLNYHFRKRPTVIASAEICKKIPPD